MRDWSRPRAETDVLSHEDAGELVAAMPSPAETDEFPQTEFTEAEAAAFLGMSPSALARRRQAGRGPVCFSLRLKRDAVFAAMGWIKGVDPAAAPADPYEAARWTPGTGRADLGDLRYQREALEAWQRGTR